MKERGILVEISKYASNQRNSIITKIPRNKWQQSLIFNNSFPLNPSPFYFPGDDLTYVYSDFGRIIGGIGMPSVLLCDSSLATKSLTMLIPFIIVLLWVIIFLILSSYSSA